MEVRPVHSCNDCAKRDSCKSICAEVEKLLPPENGRPRADLHLIDREVVWRIQDSEAKLLPAQREVARLHFRFGFSEDEIAHLHGVGKAAVSRKLRGILRKCLQKHAKNVNKTV